MNQPGSAIVWRETDHDMRRMDIEDYLHTHKIPSSEQYVSSIEQCVHKKLKPYTNVNVTDHNGPSLESLLEKCTNND